MTEKQPLVQCVYKSQRQFEQHAVLMLETGYAISGINGLRPRVEVDRASVRAFLACDIGRLFAGHGEPSGTFRVTYRLITHAACA